MQGVVRRRVPYLHTGCSKYTVDAKRCPSLPFTRPPRRWRCPFGASPLLESAEGHVGISSELKVLKVLIPDRVSLSLHMLVSLTIVHCAHTVIVTPLPEPPLLLPPAQQRKKSNCHALRS